MDIYDKFLEQYDRIVAMSKHADIPIPVRYIDTTDPEELHYLKSLLKENDIRHLSIKTKDHPQHEYRIFWFQHSLNIEYHLCLLSNNINKQRELLADDSMFDN